ncbi:SdiA-regulated domain-containing protein [Pedobacter polaris]|nr:SdiA-regulated domain-containing protein [Pedobacter polaris]
MLSNSKIRMEKSTLILLGFIVITISFSIISCAQKKAKGAGEENPKGYDLSKPEKYIMPDILQEISGIAFDKGKNDFVYAQQDEDGSLFKLPLGTKDETVTKFAKKGDYEDVAIIQGWAVLLKSNGELYSFQLSETKNTETTNVKVSENLVPKGEYEGMYADEATGKVYLLCKSCKVDKDTKNSSGYILDLQKDGSFKAAGNFTIDVSSVDKMSGKKKGSFHPSALAINPLTKEWYIVSSVNKALVVTDANFKIKSVYHLSSNEFNQPEGIAFDSSGNLYISNEGSETTGGNILRFNYKKP